MISLPLVGSMKLRQALSMNNNPPSSFSPLESTDGRTITPFDGCLVEHTELSFGREIGKGEKMNSPFMAESERTALLGI